MGAGSSPDAGAAAGAGVGRSPDAPSGGREAYHTGLIFWPNRCIYRFSPGGRRPMRNLLLGLCLGLAGCARRPRDAGGGAHTGHRQPPGRTGRDRLRGLHRQGGGRRFRRGAGAASGATWTRSTSRKGRSSRRGTSFLNSIRGPIKGYWTRRRPRSTRMSAAQAMTRRSTGGIFGPAPRRFLAPTRKRPWPPGTSMPPTWPPTRRPSRCASGRGVHQ